MFFVFGKTIFGGKIYRWQFGRIRTKFYNDLLQDKSWAMTCNLISVTILGDLLDFGQLFKAFRSNYFAQISHILRHFCEGVKIFIFSSEFIFGQLL